MEVREYYWIPVMGVFPMLDAAEPQFQVVLVPATVSAD
jgi:hypothetical protein